MSTPRLFRRYASSFLFHLCCATLIFAVLILQLPCLAQNGFLTAVNYNAGTQPYSVAVGDFNGDGKADLAVANAISNNVSVLVGNGDGTFQAAGEYSRGSG